MGATLVASPSARADCPFCEIAAIQDASFAVGHRFLTLTQRQAELARRGITGGGFARDPRVERKPPEEPNNWAGAILESGRKPSVQGWAMWTAGFGNHGARGDSMAAGSVAQSVTASGIASGIDYRFSHNLLVGAALAFGAGGYSVDTRTSIGSTHSALLGLYGSWSGGGTDWAGGALNIDAALVFGYSDLLTRRTITTGVPEQANATFTGHHIGARLEVGYHLIPSIPFDVMPFAAVTVQRLRHGGFLEDSRIIAGGALGTQGLAVAGQTTWSARSELGLQLQPPWFLDLFALVTPRVRVAWAHEFNTGRSITVNPGGLVQGVRPGRDSLLVSGGATFQIRGVNGYAQFDGEWSGSSSIYGFSGGLRMSW